MPGLEGGGGWGVKPILDFGTYGKHEVIAIPFIQFIIGDCKGNDTLCSRKGGHALNMKGLCRDCNISPENGDDTCIDRPLLFKHNHLKYCNSFYGFCRKVIGTPAQSLKSALVLLTHKAKISKISKF